MSAESAATGAPMPPRWPTQIDYQDALDNASSTFIHPALRRAEPVDRLPFGLPCPISGQFANVYRLRLATGGDVAVRLFLAPQADREVRYAAFAAHVAALGPLAPSALVRFQYQRDGLMVGGAVRPLVLMDWVDGVPLAEFIEAHLYEAARLRALSEQWLQLTAAMATAQIAHGDLQHGNVLVENGEGDRLRLIDYDGVWVPSLARLPGHEAGHPAYRHRDRKATDSGPSVDLLPARSIYVALRAVAVAPEVWFRLHDGDNLIFRREDLVDPETGRAFSTLLGALGRDHEAINLVREFKATAMLPYPRPSRIR